MNNPNEKDNAHDDDIEPVYNPVTADGESPVDDWLTDFAIADLLDIDAIYNPITMEFASDEDENP